LQVRTPLIVDVDNVVKLMTNPSTAKISAALLAPDKLLQLMAFS
jgi:hypothetical protein